MGEQHLEALGGSKMKRRHLLKLLMFLVITILIISVNGITLAKDKKNGPPKHAKAHGYRAKHTYQYYPDAKVYYDVSRGSYFYLEVNDRVPTVLNMNCSGICVAKAMVASKPVQ
jgi:hypothetical protein